MAANPSIQLGTDGNWAIKEDNLLAYKKDGTRFFNKEFDFSRGSFATFVDKDGLIKVSGLQETNLVQNGNFSELGPELVTNGDFATDSDWTKGPNWSIEDGKANCDGTDATSNLFQSITSFTGKSFLVEGSASNVTQGYAYVSLGGIDTQIVVNSNGSFKHYVTISSGSSNLFISARNNFIGSIDNISVKQVDPNDYWTLGTGWSFGDGVAICDGTDGVNLSQNSVIENGKTYKIKLDVNLTSGILLLRVGLSYSTDLTINESGSYQIIVVSDGTNFILRSGVFNGSVSNISVQEVQADTPRIDFTDDATGHLLLEPQSTNLVQYSEDFTTRGGLWQTFGNANKTLLAAISPDGKKTAALITGLNGAGDNDFRYAFPFNTANKTLTYSVYLKGSGTLRIQISNGVDQAFQNTITLTPDWKRHYVTASFNSTSVNTVYLVLDDLINLTATEYYVWGAQFEELSYATSYIPTFGSTATRNAESCNNSGSAQDFNDSEGVLYCEIAALHDDSTNRKIAIGSSTNRIIFGYRNGLSKVRAEIISSNSVVYDNTQTINNITTFNKFALKYKQNDFSLWINSQKVSIDTSGNTPTGLNELAFDDGSANPFYGKTKNLKVFKRALSDGELYLLTVTQYQSYQEMATALNYTL